MSKLYLSADTDMIRTTHTARGNRRVSVRVGYDEGNYEKKIHMSVQREDDDIKLFVSDTRKDLLICEGTIKEGIMSCKSYEP